MAYSQEEKESIIDFVCNEISKGNSLRRVFNDNEQLPPKKTFFEWIKDDVEKSDQYARAIEERQDLLFEEILDIADNSKKDERRDRLRIDSRKWMLGKMNPKKYGDRTIQDVNLKPMNEKEMNDEELTDRLNKIISKGKG